MFERDHHLRIATILQSLDADLLKQKSCLFGGGTAIVLTHGEYRESADIDFLISNLNGYRDLRDMLKGQNNLSPILREGMGLELSRDIRVDQYGIRTMIKVAQVEIKFEIVNEGRIQFDDPGMNDKVCGVSTLTPLDMGTSKLLANSDRWPDPSVFSRDIIDLAMLGLAPDLFAQAIKKAEGAYGKTVREDLRKTIDDFKKHQGKLGECMEALKMDKFPEALMWEKIKSLKKILSQA